MAQSFTIRECYESEIPSGRRAKYYEEAHQVVQDFYMLLLESVGNTDNRDVIIDQLINDDHASTLKTDFLLTQDHNLSFCNPLQYFTKFESIYKDLVEKVEFVVDNFKDGKIMMNSLVSCYIPVEYDLTLMEGNKTLFKRRCRMHCLFPKVSADKLVKVMQVEPVRDIIIQAGMDNNTTIEPGDNMDKNKISAYLSRHWSDFYVRLIKNRWVIGLFFIFCVLYLTISEMIEERSYKGLTDITKRFLRLCAFSVLIVLGVLLPLAVAVFFFREKGFVLYAALYLVAFGVQMIRFRTGRENWFNWLLSLLSFGASILIIYMLFTNQLDFIL